MPTKPVQKKKKSLRDTVAEIIASPEIASPTADEKTSTSTAEIPCTDAPTTGESVDTVAVSTNAPVEPAPGGTEGITKDRGIMELTFTKNVQERKSQAEVYVAAGYPGSVRFSKTLFPAKVGPDAVTITADFRAPRKEETKEERKARLAAAPKPTLEQKIAAQEAKLAKLRAKAATPAAA
jgi:hypothetical protein